MVVRRRRIRGDRSFRRILQRLPESIRTEMVAMMEGAGDDMVAAMRAAAPKGQTGRTAAALSRRVSRATLRMRVGIIGKPLNRRLYYARILEVGRKASGRGIKKGTPKYQAGVGRRSPQRFVSTPTVRQIRDSMGGRLNGYWERVLQNASRGVSDG